MERAVLDDLGIRGVFGVGVHVSLVGIQLLSVYGEGSGVENLNLAGFHISLDSGNLVRGAGSGSLLIDVGQLYGAGSDSAGPVGVDRLAVTDALEAVGEVRSPVDAGRNDKGVRSNRLGGAVVGNVRNTGVLTGRRSAHGVRVLGDQLAAVLDQRVGAFLFSGLIVPGTGEGDFHRSGRADRTRAEEEAGVARNNFRVGECADVADLGFFRGEFTGFDHLVQLQACSDAGKITALEDLCERVVVVRELLGMSLGAGSVAELNVRVFLGGLDHVVFMTEGIREDEIAALIDKVHRGVVALLTFRDVGLQDRLDAESLAGFLRAVQEVEVIGRVFVMQEDESGLDGRAGGAVFAILGRRRVAGGQAEHHGGRKYKSE